MTQMHLFVGFLDSIQMPTAFSKFGIEIEIEIEIEILY